MLIEFKILHVAQLQEALLHPSVRPSVSSLTFEPSDLDLLQVYGS